MLLEVEGATLDDIREALSLLDGATVKVVEQKVEKTDPNWCKMPKTDTQRQRVLLKFLEQDWTRDELVADTGESDSAIDSRVLELEQGGHLVKTGETRVTRFGGEAAVLTLTAITRRELRLVPTKWFPGNVRPKGS